MAHARARVSRKSDVTVDAVLAVGSTCDRDDGRGDADRWGARVCDLDECV
jgi:hypothetical protein